MPILGDHLCLLEEVWLGELNTELEAWGAKLSPSLPVMISINILL